MLRKFLLVISILGTVAGVFFWPIQSFVRVHYYYEWFQAISNMERIVEEARNQPGENDCPNRHLAERYDEYPLVVRDTSIRVEFDADCRTMTLTGQGPNRRDDHGKDDDIVMDVDARTYEFAWPAFPYKLVLSVLCRTPMWAVISALAAYPLIVLLFGSASDRRVIRGTFSGFLAFVPVASCILLAISFSTSIRWKTEHWSDWIVCGPNYISTPPQSSVTIARGNLWITYDGPSGIRCGCVPPTHNLTPYNISADSWVLEAFGYILVWAGHHNGCSHPHSVRLVTPFWPLIVISAPYPLWILLLRPLRHNRRRKRSLCVRCAYDLRGNTSGICPECGTPIAQGIHPVNDEAI